jgi:hypothetical protein
MFVKIAAYLFFVKDPLAVRLVTAACVIFAIGIYAISA